jgi:outer membrane protein assembly factor BamB
MALDLTGTAAGLLAADGAKPSPNDWPWWRGPSGDGVSTDTRVVTEWSKTKNVVWKTAVPGRGHSSPVLWGARVFLTTADEGSQTQSVLALDRNTGKTLWTTVAHKGGLMNKHGKNSHASATSACDGERVYSVFINSDALHVTATSLDGKILWQSSPGPFRSEHGYGSSPVLYKSLVIVNGDNLSGCFIAALDRKTGKQVWKTPRKTTGRHGSYATPIVAKVAGRTQLLLHGMETMSSYDPDTGKLLWSCAGPTEVTACTVAFNDKLVFASGGYPDKEILAIRPDGSGDVTKTHVAWRSRKGVTYVPSPLYHDGHLYVVNDGGVTSCFAADTGDQVWQERLEGSFSASPVLAGGNFYVTNEAGRTFVFKAGPKFQLIAQNDLADGGFATPAIVGGQIFLRTEHNLLCIGQPTDRASRN